MITNGDVAAGAEAVKEIADKYGVGAFISEEQRKEIALAVLEAVDKYRDKN